MKLNNKVLFMVILIVVFGGIGTAMALNVWNSTPGTKAASDTAAAADPAYIKGSDSFADISLAYNIPLEDLRAAFAPNSTAKFADMKARELKTLYSKLENDITVETESVRIFAAMYTNVPYYYSNAAYLPETAVKVLKEKTKLSPEQLTFLGTHTIDVSGKP
jgi:hypothetical protein